MPYGFGFRQPSKQSMVRTPECSCVCHPIMERPKVWKDRKCQTCWEDGGKPWVEFLESALEHVPRV